MKTTVRKLLAVLLSLCILLSLTACADVLDFVGDVTGLQIGQEEDTPPAVIPATTATTPPPATTAPKGYNPNFVLNTFGTPVTSCNNAIVYSQANPNSSVIGQVPMNEKLMVTTVAHYGATVMACIGDNAWVDLHAIVFDGCAQSGAIPCKIKGQGVWMRTGPGTEYPSKGSFDKFDPIIVTNIFYATDGKAWGKIGNGYWVSFECIYPPEGLSIGYGNNAGAYIP